MKILTIVAASALMLLTCAHAAVAQPMKPRLIKVTACEPRANAAALPAYAPAYYPGYPFYWYDVYGMRYYQPPYAAAQPTLAIDYSNQTAKVMREIEFGLVANGRLIAEVRDVGTFSPNAEIKHEFGLDPNVFPIGTSFARCIPLRVTFADGTTWRNPHLPALRRSIYHHPRR